MELTEVLGLFREANKIAKNRKLGTYQRTLSYLVGLQYRITQLMDEISRFNKVEHGRYTVFDDRIRELGGDVYWYLSQLWDEAHLKAKKDHNHPYFDMGTKLTKEDLEKQYCAFHLIDHDDLDEVDYSGVMNSVYYQGIDINRMVSLSIVPVMYLVNKAINNPDQKDEDSNMPHAWVRDHIDPLVYAVFNKITVLVNTVGFTVDDCLDAMVTAIRNRA